MLNATVFATFFFIGVGVLLLQVLHKFVSKAKTNTNPQFLQFQRTYLTVYFLVLLGDWLNAPYLYKLYASYGFIEDQIAIIYVCGFASALAFGVVSSYAVNRHGKCRVFVIATFVYAVSCFIKLSSNYTLLIVGRMFSGAATSLLFSAQEAWYLHSHIQVHDFPIDWIEYTLTAASKGSSLLAISAGVLSYLLCEVYSFGPVVPSVLSVPLLLVSCVCAIQKWKQGSNSGKKPEQMSIKTNTPPSIIKLEKKQIFKGCCKELQLLVQSTVLLQVGFVQALFESVLCLFVFLWTPVLDHHHPPLGMVFASFMVSAFFGASLYRLIKSIWHLASALIMIGILLVAGAAVLTCVLSTAPTSEFPVLSYCAFLLFEFASGMYFPAMSDIKKDMELEKDGSSATRWFRVPLNLFACAGLLLLHSSTNTTGTKNLFACCFAAVMVAFIISIRLHTHLKEKARISPGDGESLL